MHVDHGVCQAVLVAKRHYPVVETLHNATLSGIELLVRPLITTPGDSVVLRWLLEVVVELGCNDQSREDDELGTHAVNV